MKIYRIYAIAYDNGVVCYIGRTSQTIKNRFSYHKTYAKNGGTSPLSEEIRKYGAETFRAFQLSFTRNSETADKLERKFIKFYKILYPDGCNVQSGGKVGCWMTLEGIKRIEDGQIKASKRRIKNGLGNDFDKTMVANSRGLSRLGAARLIRDKKLIYEAWLRGVSQAQIARNESLSRERIRQIVERECRDR